jgi:hypothetical protein
LEHAFRAENLEKPKKKSFKRDKTFSLEEKLFFLKREKKSSPKIVFVEEKLSCDTHICFS